MEFQLLLHEKAKTSFDKLDDEIAELKQYPERGIGDYRAIYEIDKQNKKVIVLYIGHRSEVYLKII